MRFLISRGCLRSTLKPEPKSYCTVALLWRIPASVERSSSRPLRKKINAPASLVYSYDLRMLFLIPELYIPNMSASTLDRNSSILTTEFQSPNSTLNIITASILLKFPCTYILQNVLEPFLSNHCEAPI